MASVKGKSNVFLVQDEQGKWCYPATKRADGTWRKPIPVRDTHIPPELQEKYICKGRREADAAAAAAKLAIKEENPESQFLEEDTDTTDFRMDHGKKDVKSAPKKNGAFSMPRMDQYWSHLVPPDPVVSSAEPRVPPTSKATSSTANHSGDHFDGPRMMDKMGSDNSWDNPTPQNVASVPTVDYEEKCRTWKNMEDVCGKLSGLKLKEKKEAGAGEDERSLAALLDKEKKEDMEHFRQLVIADQLSPPDHVNNWNYLVTKWIRIQQMLGVVSNAEIVKVAKSFKLVM